MYYVINMNGIKLYIDYNVYTLHFNCSYWMSFPFFGNKFILIDISTY